VLGLSNTAGYAILALGCMKECNGAWILTRDIAKRTGISSTYLSKILHGLAKSGLIAAKRGYRGGFKLSRSASKISLMEVVEAVEGRAWTGRCLLGLAECSDERSCPAHDFWKTTRIRIESKLQRLKLSQVAEFEGMFDLPAADARAPKPLRANSKNRRKSSRGAATRSRRKTTVTPRRSKTSSRRARSKRK
jgi:Rrf2 family protein